MWERECVSGRESERVCVGESVWEECVGERVWERVRECVGE